MVLKLYNINNQRYNFDNRDHIFERRNNQMANRMILNETSYFGAGSISEIVTEAKKRAFKKALVVTDPDLIKFNVAKNVTDLLEKAGLAYDIFSQVKANPTVKVVKAGIEAFKAAGADYLIAIGGGSSMDTAKAIGIIINNPEYADVTSLEGAIDTKNPCVPIILQQQAQPQR